MEGDEEAIRVGVEEEFHVVDLSTRRLAARADLLLESLPPESYARELQRSTVESNSAPFMKLDDLARDLGELRRRLVEQADAVELGIVAAGSAPLVERREQKVSQEPRYEQMLSDYQQLTRDQLICGTHVHAQVRDPDLAVAVAHRLTPWVPPLLALSASSPYWDGEDTGYASYRSLVWQRWPTAGPIDKYDSAAEYDEMIKELIRTGVITDPGMIYSDIRPSQHVPTVELRICDSCPRVEDIVLITGLFRAMVARELQEIRQGVERTVQLAAVRAASWQAARSGLEGELIDPVSGVPRPAPVVIRRLVEGLRPQLEETGDAELVSVLVKEVLARGTSAERQRRAFARRGRLTDVVDLLLAETRAYGWDRPGDPPAYRSAS
ncbi:glutamate--cysteine ligase [Nonomuraea sp. NPDC049421]|uniref:carboxylate-amine ligase n=1 Tax=Nonomuraea sp. NPDC049421 TaxID=3155275 RepID=UPI0034317725